MNLSDVAIVEVPVAQFFKVKDTMNLFTDIFSSFFDKFCQCTCTHSVEN